MEKKLQAITVETKDGTKVAEYDDSTIIRISAKNGHYKISLSQDPNFPGVYISFISDNEEVRDEEDPCVIVEQVEETIEPRTVVYKRGQDEPETIINLTE